MITFKCFSCGATLRVSDEKSGKRGKCPRCALMVRVPHSQAEADTAEAHRVAKRARVISPPRIDKKDDLFSDVVSEVLGSSRMQMSPDRPADTSRAPASPKVLATGPIDASGDVVTQAMQVARQESAQPAEADQAPPTPTQEAPDPEAMRQSAEAPSAPPMSWPVDRSDPDNGPGSDPDALARATRQSPTRLAAAETDEGVLAAVLDAAAPVAPQQAEFDRTASAPGNAAPVGAGTASVRGAHGLPAMFLLFIVALSILALVAWRNWEHTWDFAPAITRCLPMATFDSPGDGDRARTGAMTGKILLCNDMGGPCPVPLVFDEGLIARSVDQVGTVIFIRRNDKTPQTRTFRQGEKIFATAPVGYELCAVDVKSNQRICTVAVTGENAGQATEKLYWLIKRCVRPGRRK